MKFWSNDFNGATKAWGALFVINLLLLSVSLLRHDIFGLLVNAISASVCGISTYFNYKIRHLVRNQRRQTIISLTIGE